MAKKIKVALAGNPNAGKTSLFNQLTGARAHVGNYPGVTVEKKEGKVIYDGAEIQVVDLPGTYSLTAYSLEELVARKYILDERPDVIVDVVDAANLERNLYLAVQFMEIGIPVVIALNMMDIAEARGIRIDLEKMKNLLGVEIIPTIARTKKGIEELLTQVVKTAEAGNEWTPKHIRYGPDLDVRITEIISILDERGPSNDKLPHRWLAVKTLEGDSQVLELLEENKDLHEKITGIVQDVSRHLKTTLDDEPEGIIADHRYGFITSVTKQAVTTVKDLRRTISDNVDLVVLNRLVGPLFLLLILYVVYQFTFWVSETPVAWFETLFGWLGDYFNSVLPEGPVRSLLVSGIIDGVGGVIGFVPLIAFMFFAIAILEDSGYMARIAFIMDRVLRTFGLHGNSVLALMVSGGISGGCAVPGVMAARTLRDPKERLATILVTPFMNCGAKLPVYAVLISAFFPAKQGHMMFALTLIAWTMALLSARLLRWTLLRGDHTPFVMELPPYRIPTLKGLLIHSWERIWDYLKKAGTVILAISIVIWAMMTYPGLPDELDNVFQHQREKFQQILFQGAAGTIIPDGETLEEFEGYLDDIIDEDPDVSLKGDNARFRVFASTLSTIKAGNPLRVDQVPYEKAAGDFLRYQSEMAELDGARAHAALRRSYAGRLGAALENVTSPLGFDWRTNIALIGGFAAKEVIISTLGTSYSMSDSNVDQEESLKNRLAAEPGWNPLTAFCLMLFVMLYSPCFATLVVIGRETGWRWAVFSVVYTTAIAYMLSLGVMIAGKALGLGF